MKQTKREVKKNRLTSKSKAGTVSADRPRGWKSLDPNPFLILALAVFLRSFNLARMLPFCDEGFYRAATSYYMKFGTLAYSYWHHPPMKYFFFYLAELLFGNSFFAYRMVSLFFGSLTVLVLFFLTRRLTGDYRASLLAMVFLAVDPMHVIWSRIAIEEASQVFFILLSVLLFLRVLERFSRADLLMAGLCLGAAIGFKWESLPLIPLYLAFFVFYEKLEGGKTDLGKLAALTLYLVVLPFSVYLLLYLPWFRQGHTFVEWLTFQFQMGVSALEPIEYTVIVSTRMAAVWFLIPVYQILSYLTPVSGTMVYLVAFTNPSSWLLVYPSIFLELKELRKDIPLMVTRALPVLVFAAVYLPMITVSRPVYPHSSPVFAPLVAYFAARLITGKLERDPGSKLPVIWAAVIIACSLVLYPFTAGLGISENYFRYVTDFYALFILPR